MGKSIFSSLRHAAPALLLAAALLAGQGAAFAQPDTAYAREVVAEVNGKLASLEQAAFSAQRRNVEYRSAVKAWRDGSGVRKLEVTDLDDSGSVVTEYYYRDGALVFAYVAVKGFNDAGREVTRVEQREYYRDGRLFHWLGGLEKMPIPATDPGFARESKERLAASAFYAEAAKAAFAQPDTVRVGNTIKRTTGKVVSLTPGDVACYLELEDAKGARFTEMADFDLCRQEAALVGRTVSLSYVVASVASPKCQGDPNCRQTERVPLVKAARVVDAGAPAKPAGGPRPPGQASFCTPLEETIFACRTSAKLVSVCASKDAGPARGYAQYRFGKPDSRDPIELTLPESLLPPARVATAAAIPFAGGGAAWMRFRKGDHAYVVFSGIGKWGPKGETLERAGLVVERGGKRIAHLACTGPVTGDLGPDWFGKVGLESRGEDFDLPP